MLGDLGQPILHGASAFLCLYGPAYLPYPGNDSFEIILFDFESDLNFITLRRTRAGAEEWLARAELTLGFPAELFLLRLVFAVRLSVSQIVTRFLALLDSCGGVAGGGRWGRGRG